MTIGHISIPSSLLRVISAQSTSLVYLMMVQGPNFTIVGILIQIGISLTALRTKIKRFGAISAPTLVVYFTSKSEGAQGKAIV